MQAINWLKKLSNSLNLGKSGQFHRFPDRFSILPSLKGKKKKMVQTLGTCVLCWDYWALFVIALQFLASSVARLIVHIMK